MEPHFESQEMVKKHKLCSNTNRHLMCLSHFTFKERLKTKCFEYNVHLKLVDESYTSKTCTQCGMLNQSLSGKKIFECKKCEIKINRDVNGARNIYLKNT
jgi:putative transposase